MNGFKKHIKRCLYAVVPTLRIKTVTRTGLDNILVPFFKGTDFGTVLDVGSYDSPYRKHIRCTRYTRFDIDADTRPDIVGDLHDTRLQPDAYDCVIATEVLEHLYEPQKAVDEVRRILKPGGQCVFSTRFFYVYHPAPRDYYRFTQDGLEHLFRNFSEVRIVHHGNLVQSLWQLLNDKTLTAAVFNVFNPLVARINFKTTRYPLGFVVFARK